MKKYIFLVILFLVGCGNSKSDPIYIPPSSSGTPCTQCYGLAPYDETATIACRLSETKDSSTTCDATVTVPELCSKYTNSIQDYEIKHFSCGKSFDFYYVQK